MRITNNPLDEALAVSTKVLEDIKEELQEIKLLYKELVEKLIPTEEPTKEEKKALKEKDEIASEEELMKTLGWTECSPSKLKGKRSKNSKN